MKITETHEYYNSDHDNASQVNIEILTDSGEALDISIGEGSPEDMYLFRDLSDAYSISDAIRMAYDAGKRGEEFTYELIEEKDE